MLEQNELQGLISRRVSHLNRFRTGMADLVLNYNPIAQQVQVYLMDKSIDVWGDSETLCQEVIEKRAIVSKNPDMVYVQDLFGYLVEDDDQLPWVIKMTVTGLPRLINHDDQIRVGNILYTVSKVAPTNRMADGLLKILVYPERNGDNG